MYSNSSSVARAPSKRKNTGSRRRSATSAVEQSPASPASFDEWQHWFSRRPLPPLHLTPSASFSGPTLVLPEDSAAPSGWPAVVAPEWAGEKTVGGRAARADLSEPPCFEPKTGTKSTVPVSLRRRLGRRPANRPSRADRSRLRRFDDWSRWFWGSATP